MTKLYRELLKSGSSADEARDLEKVAFRLRASKPTLSDAARERIAERLGLPDRSFVSRHRWTTLSLSGAMVAVALAFISLSALPGGKLYALKRTVERVHTIVQPSFVEHVAAERHDEVEKLKKTGASQIIIKKAESEAEQAEQKAEEHKSSESKKTETQPTTNTTASPSGSPVTNSTGSTLGGSASNPSTSGSTSGGSGTGTSKKDGSSDESGSNKVKSCSTSGSSHSGGGSGGSGAECN